MAEPAGRERDDVRVPVRLACGLAFLSACADPWASIDRKMSEIRREQCDPLPTEPQRKVCIQQVNDIEDDALRQLDETVANKPSSKPSTKYA
jgi:hypothetical protein